MNKVLLSVIPAKAGPHGRIDRHSQSLAGHSQKLGIHIFCVFCLFLIPISNAFATAPTSITLSYDKDNGVLHVVAVHPSFDLTKSYVRLMNVYVNGSEVTTLNYFRQNDYNKFTDDVPVVANAGDIIKIELFCSLGGDLSQEMTVAKLSDADAGQTTDTASGDNAVSNESDNAAN